MINLVKRFIRTLGFDIVRYNPAWINIPPDIDPETANVIRRAKPFTMSSPERVFALCEAVKYVVVNQIPGDIIECGVWKGGSMMAVAHTLLRLQDTSRELYLFDTFDGMTAPSEQDISVEGTPAAEIMRHSKKDDPMSVWCYAPLDEVRQTINSIGYDNQKIHYIQGKVEETIPSHMPSTIALLRLDTDWYESTRHELNHLFPRISDGGVIIIDDYGHWQGTRQAVDEYLQENKVKLLLNRIDYTGRIGIVQKCR